MNKSTIAAMALVAVVTLGAKGDPHASVAAKGLDDCGNCKGAIAFPFPVVIHKFTSGGSEESATPNVPIEAQMPQETELHEGTSYSHTGNNGVLSVALVDECDEPDDGEPYPSWCEIEPEEDEAVAYVRKDNQSMPSESPSDPGHTTWYTKGCVYYHLSCEEQDGPTIADVHAIVEAAETEPLQQLLQAYPASVSLNAARSSIQVRNCQGVLVANLPLSKAVLSALQ